MVITALGGLLGVAFAYLGLLVGSSLTLWSAFQEGADEGDIHPDHRRSHPDLVNRHSLALWNRERDVARHQGGQAGPDRGAEIE